MYGTISDWLKVPKRKYASRNAIGCRKGFVKEDDYAAHGILSVFFCFLFFLQFFLFRILYVYFEQLHSFYFFFHIIYGGYEWCTNYCLAE